MTDRLATISQLSAFLGREIDETDPSAGLALDVASSAVRGYCGHHVSSVTGEVVALDGTGTTLLLLPGPPVTSVASVTVEGDALDPSDYRWSAAGFILRTDGACFPDLPRAVEVEMTHGWAQIPAAIIGVVCSLAGRILDGSAGIKQEAIGSYSVTYASPSPTLQAAESAALDPFRVDR